MKKDTYNEALAKAVEFVKGKNWKSIWPLGKCLNVSYYDDDMAICVEEFPYSVQREPQLDDLYHVWDTNVDSSTGHLRRLVRFEATDNDLIDSNGSYWSNYKPTGFRWDVATASIVKIEDEND
jgi:hypothetical protein